MRWGKSGIDWHQTNDIRVPVDICQTVIQTIYEIIELTIRTLEMVLPRFRLIQKP